MLSTIGPVVGICDGIWEECKKWEAVGGIGSRDIRGGKAKKKKEKMGAQGFDSGWLFLNGRKEKSQRRRGIRIGGKKESD